MHLFVAIFLSPCPSPPHPSLSIFLFLPLPSFLSLFLFAFISPSFFFYGYCVLDGFAVVQGSENSATGRRIVVYTATTGLTKQKLSSHAHVPLIFKFRFGDQYAFTAVSEWDILPNAQSRQRFNVSY